MDIPIPYVTSQATYAQQDAASAWDWPLTDGLGSIRAVLDEAGNPLHAMHYTPYGEPFEATGTPQMPHGFTGEPTDPNGLVYLRVRYYVPGLGVFPSLDPVEGYKEIPSSLNRYAYVRGNPANAIDPSGLQTEFAFCGGLVLADGPAPFGDIACATILVLVALGVLQFNLPAIGAPVRVSPGIPIKITFIPRTSITPEPESPEPEPVRTPDPYVPPVLTPAPTATSLPTPATPTPCSTPTETPTPTPGPRINLDTSAMTGLVHITRRTLEKLWHGKLRLWR